MIKKEWVSVLGFLLIPSVYALKPVSADLIDLTHNKAAIAKGIGQKKSIEPKMFQVKEKKEEGPSAANKETWAHQHHLENLDEMYSNNPEIKSGGSVIARVKTKGGGHTTFVQQSDHTVSTIRGY